MVGKTVDGMIESCEGDVAFGKTNSFVPFVIDSKLKPTILIKKAIVSGFDAECSCPA